MKLLLLGCGSNKYGETFGKDSLLVPGFKEIALPSYVSGIKQIACGLHSSILLDDRNQLYTWGKSINKAFKPHKVNFFSVNDIEICDVSCRNTHTAALTKDGNVYVWGKNTANHLPGNEDIDEACPLLIKMPNDTRATKVACGGFFTVVLLEDGSLCTFGINQNSSLGRNSDNNSATPVIIPMKYFNFTPITQIAVGWTHSVAISYSNEVYSWGRRNNGRLGHDKGESIAIMDFHNNKRIKEVFCGDTSTFMIDDEHKLYATGWNHSGENGMGDFKTRKIMRPVKSALNLDIVHIASSGQHTFALTSDHEVYATGANENNCLGLGESIDSVNVMTKIQHLTNVCMVATGFSHSLFVIQIE